MWLPHEYRQSISVPFISGHTNDIVEYSYSSPNKGLQKIFTVSNAYVIYIALNDPRTQLPVSSWLFL